MALAFIGLGSNLGDRAAALQFAVDAFRETKGVESVRCSTFYETTPVGPVPQGDFLNAVAAVETSLSPVTLLTLGQSIEQHAGRKRDIHWGPRTLDVDLLAYDRLKLSTKALTLPHPEAYHRAFVLAPWAELAPNFLLNGKAVAEWLAEVGNQGIRKFDCG
ncbi:2-amino-4-hydroxy-6-hydroxymethyldihydropteridine diphosphokinase [Cerasicoccus maritimus]|uniref:2-amino-4-hydroxy-6- hydroxymethyldihydropteridine diphosphokinase n=1 Tax=Cerasicoccus maritimus TaxID=490089 RepID=UPI002852C9E3|nr:2-amino-4-hydroxy-6-hydroxymethyldihydropteridine diphosphokinase [Cerasicoccus maritimus]